MKNNEGFSLIELLVVVIVFAIIGVVASETIILTLRGTSKADATTKVRNNLDFAVGAMERQIRGAQKIDSSTTCNNTAQNSLAIVDQDDNKVTFSCVGENVNHLPSYVASASAALTPVALTSSNITISNCSFTCIPATSVSPAQVLISITGQDSGSQFVPVTVSTQITLRSF